MKAKSNRSSLGASPNSVDLGETRSGSRAGFRRITGQTETLGEFRYVKPTPIGTSPLQARCFPKAIINQRAFFVAILLTCVASGCNPPGSAHPNPATGIESKTGVESKKVDDPMPPILIKVSISPEARVKAASEEIAMELHRGQWQDFSIEIDNAAGITAPLVIESEQILATPDDTSRERWLQIEIKPNGALTGLRHETRTLRLRSRDTGFRTAILNFNAGQGTQDLGFRSDVLVTFKIDE